MNRICLVYIEKFFVFSTSALTIFKYQNFLFLISISIYFRSNTTQHCQKTPLIVVSLCIAPDTKTLAPTAIKRDPRKQPPFCQYFKIPTHQSVDEKQQNYPEFLIRGIEITEKTKNSSAENVPSPDDILLDTTIVHDECTCCVPNELLLNLDGYEMDNFGHLPGDSRTPTPMRGTMLLRDGHRKSSPATEQVIRITMNNKIVNGDKRRNYPKIIGTRILPVLSK